MNTGEYIVYTNNSQTTAPENFSESTLKKGNIVDQPYILFTPQFEYATIQIDIEPIQDNIENL